MVDWQGSAFERLSACRTRLAALRLARGYDDSRLKPAVEALWQELTALTARAQDEAAIEALCAHVDRLLEAYKLL